VGVGIPTVTTYKGQPGTGILWITDPDVSPTAFNAVLDNNGILQPITQFATGGLNKFQRPAFGDGRLYVSDVNGTQFFSYFIFNFFILFFWAVGLCNSGPNKTRLKDD